MSAAPEERPAAAGEERDLLDELGLTDLERDSASWLDQPPHVVTPDLARLTGHATDYQWCTWIPAALRAALVPVIEHRGWATNGRPRSAGPFVPAGVMVHHDASRVGPSPASAEFIFRIGRPTEGIPAPLAQLWVCLGCNGAHAVGTWHVGAAGRANHAGRGDGWRDVRADEGNATTLGVELDHTTGEEIPCDLYDSLVNGCAGLLAHMGSDPRDWLPAHREYAPGRKIDPAGLDMDEFRRDVLERMSSRGKRVAGYPGGEHFTVGHDCAGGHVRQLEKWLLTLNPKSRHRESAVFTRWTRDRVQAFQESRRALATTTHLGFVDQRTWRKLQAAARVAS